MIHRINHLCIHGMLMTILAVLAPIAALSAGALVEIGAGYNIPIGTWSDVYGTGMTYGGTFGFTFGEFLNPGIGAWLIFPAVGSIIQNEYEQTHHTTSISLFSATTIFSLSNRAYINLSDRNTLTLEIGYGIFSQRDYVTITTNNYESVDNLSGHGALFGVGLQHAMSFSIFDFIHPFLKCYYTPDKVIYHVIGPGGGSLNDHEAGNSRIGIIAGFSLISIGEE
jgi:hypothetical protein